MHLSMAPDAIIWDGFRHLAVLWNGAAPACYLASEDAGGAVALMAANDATTGTSATIRLAGIVPPGCHVVHLVCVAPDETLSIIPVLLDERLTQDRVADGLPGLERVIVHAAGTGAQPRGLTAETLLPVAPLEPLSGSAIASGLNGKITGQDGMPRFSVGPFQHRDDAGASRIRATGVVGPDAAGLTLRFVSDQPDQPVATADILVAQITPGMTRARKALALLDPDLTLAIEMALDGLAEPVEGAERDASGIGSVAAFRRGFRLLEARAGTSEIVLPDWTPDDEVLLLSAPHVSVIWSGSGDVVTGTPMAIAWHEGVLSAVSRRERYAPSATTELTSAATAGRALVAGGTPAPMRALEEVDEAARREAERILSRSAPSAPLHLKQVLEASWNSPDDASRGPLGELTARARALQAPGRLAAAAGIEPALADELAARPLVEQIAMLGWAVSAPAFAARACAVRLLLPAQGDGKGLARAELERLLDWYEDIGLPERLTRAAIAVASHDRKAARLLHEIAAIAHEVWLDESAIKDARAAVDAAALRPGAAPLSGLAMLLSGLRRQPGRKIGALPTLEHIARLRAGLGEAARKAGERTDIVDDIDSGLAGLTPGDILLLDGHYVGIMREAGQSQAASALIATWEAAAGVTGLSMRADRAGHSLAGATRLAATMAGLEEAFARIESLRPALSRIEAGIGAALGESDVASSHARQLRATLSGYGRLLLLQTVRAEADAAFASVPFAAGALADLTDAGFGAAFRRLRSGTVETLERYLAAATIVSGVDHDWSASPAVRPASSQP